MPRATDNLTHALSFDIEDWFHIVEVKAVEDPSTWDRLSRESSLVERYTDRILRLCDDHAVKATFFILGWIADRHPALVKRIADAGHELGSHSFWHRKVYELTPEAFAEDLARSLAAIRAAAGNGTAVRGFRAPSFSITRGAEWAFDVLLDAGIEYDASLFPAPRGHGGYACTPGAHPVRTPRARTIPELPMSIARFGPARLCYSGGGYLRALPLGLIERGVRREAAAGRPTVIYLHPRDFAPDCPRVPMPLHRRFKCYTGMASTEGKLRALLRAHRWAPCAQVLAEQLRAAGGAPAPAGDRPLRRSARRPLPDPVRPGRSGPRPPVSVVILTKNEESNLRDCIGSCAWSDDVHVLDSGSDDGTAALARALGARLHTHRFESFGQQRNWAIDHIPLAHDWVFHLDADERFTEPLVAEIDRVLAARPGAAGFYVPSMLLFMNRWLKRTGSYPAYQMRLFHRARMRFKDHGHGQREDTGETLGTLREPYLHYNFSKGLYEWFEKHNRYSSLEAAQALRDRAAPLRGVWRDLLRGDKVSRWRAFKRLSHLLPARPRLLFLHTLLGQLGILDGRAGLNYLGMRYVYHGMIDVKMQVIEHEQRTGRRAASSPPRGASLSPPPPQSRAPSPAPGPGAA